MGCVEPAGSREGDLTSETVQGAALALEGVDDVHGSDGLTASVLGVSHGVTDHVLQEHLENTTSLLVDQTRDTLHTTAASQTADSGLGDTLDVIAKNLAVTLGSALAETCSQLSNENEGTYGKSGTVE